MRRSIPPKVVYDVGFTSFTSYMNNRYDQFGAPSGPNHWGRPASPRPNFTHPPGLPYLPPSAFNHTGSSQGPVHRIHQFDGPFTEVRFNPNSVEREAYLTDDSTPSGMSAKVPVFTPASTTKEASTFVEKNGNTGTEKKVEDIPKEVSNEADIQARMKDMSKRVKKLMDLRYNHMIYDQNALSVTICNAVVRTELKALDEELTSIQSVSKEGALAILDTLYALDLRHDRGSWSCVETPFKEQTDGLIAVALNHLAKAYDVREEIHGTSGKFAPLTKTTLLY